MPVDTVDNWTKSVTCEHRRRASGQYVRNNPSEGPPVILIESPEGHVIVTLTNQTIYLKCSKCHQKLKDLIVRPELTRC
jgi:hypothetical protein